MTDMIEVKELVEQFTNTAARKLTRLEANLAQEKREREELELRMQRQGVPLSGSIGRRSQPERKALADYVRTGDDTELKSMSVGSDPDGGYLVLPAMASTMVQKIFDQSAIARLARRETITAGDAWEEIVDFNEAGASWVGENSSRTATTTPQLGKIRIPVQEIYALQPVTQRLLDDTAYDLGAWVESKIGDKFGRAEGAAFVSGDGVGKPRGFLTYDTSTTSDATRAFGVIQHIKTGNASGFGTTVSGTVNPADKLVDLVYALRPPYKQGDNVAWVMNSTTAGTVRKFKDTSGAYIWQEGLQAGSPPTLLGFPVYLDEYMPDVGANEYPIAFANWDLAYKVVEKAGIRMLRDPFTSKPNVQFYAYRRVGGGLANSEAIKLLKVEE